MLKPAMEEQGHETQRGSCTQAGSSPDRKTCWLCSAPLQSEVKIPLISTAPKHGQKRMLLRCPLRWADNSNNKEVVIQGS